MTDAELLQVLLAEKDRRRSVMDPKTWGETARDVGRQVAQGATLGFADEAEAALRAPFSDRPRAEIQAEIREQNRQFEQENPVTGFGLQMGGGAVAGGVGAARAGAARVVQRMPAVLKGLLGGTGAGAAAGAGYAEEDKLGSMVPGAVAGGVLGAGGAGVRRVLKGVGEAAMDRMGREPMRVAGRKIQQALDRDAIPAEDVPRRLAEMGPEATVADLGKNVTALGEVIAQRPGPALSKAEDVFGQRRAGQANRVIGILDSEIEMPREVMRSIEGTPEFTQTLTQRIPVDREMVSIMSRPSMEKAWKKAQEIAGEQGQRLPSHSEFVDAVKGGRITEVETTVMHWLKKGLDDVLEPKRDPVTGKVLAEYGQNQLMNMNATRRAFRDLVKQRNPEYGAALGRIAAEKSIEGARAKGRDFMKLKGPAAVLQMKKSFRSDTERQEFLAGIRDAIEGRITNDAERGYDVTRSVLGQTDKIRAAFGREKGDRIIAAMKNERTLAQNENKMLRGSQTAFRQAAEEDFGLDPGGLGMAARDLTYGNVGTAAVNALRGLYAVAKRKGIGNEKVLAKIGEQLFTPGGTEDLAKILVAQGHDASHVRVILNGLQAAMASQAARGLSQ